MIADLDTKEELVSFLVERFEAEPLPQSAVDGLQSAITPGKWNALTLLNGWSNFASGYRGAAYRTIPGGGVQVAGLIQKASEPTGTVCAKLPASLAPKEALQFPSNNGGAFAVITVATDGSIFVFCAEPATNVTLSSIIFWPGS